MVLNKDIYNKYLNCKGNFNNNINCIENYNQIKKAYSKNTYMNDIKKDIIKNLKLNLYGKLELFKNTKYIDSNEHYKENKVFYVINKKCKDDIILYLDLYNNVYSHNDIIKEGWQTERTKEGKIIWSSVYNNI